MIPARSFVTVLISLAALAGAAAGEEQGNFVIRLGNDTTSVERYSRTASRLTIEQVGRSPRVLTRHYEFDFDKDGATTRAVATVTAPGADPSALPIQRVAATFSADTATVEVRRDSTGQQIQVAVPRGSVVVSNTSPWATYEIQTMRLAGQHADSLRSALYFLGSPRMSWVAFRKLGADSMVVQTENDLYHVRVDRKGRVMNVVPIVGTAKFSADRASSLDLAAMTADFLAGERQSGAMGTYSPRDSARAVAGGATLTIDYGRPAKRGRVVFGGVVPWGVIWRTGANAATQFRTDKALKIGGVSVPAGFYSLWTIPSPDGWKLLINGQTGQWGTEHKAEQDLYTIDMAVGSLPDPVERFTIGIVTNPTGGVLNLDWDTTRASVAFTVEP